MKRVLVITYYFPSGRSAGGLRVQGLARHLPEFGWEATVITPRRTAGMEEPFRVLETGERASFSLVRKLLRLDPRTSVMSSIATLKQKFGIKKERSFLEVLMAAFGELFAYPDAQKGWRKPALAAARQVLGEGAFDAVISVSPPETCHLVGKELKHEFGLPWIADFTDLWSQNPYYPYSRVRRWRDRRLEKKTLPAADRLITVSGPSAQELSELHGGRPVAAVPSGFEPLDAAHPPLTGPFTITYTGNIYTGCQTPEPLFDAVARLIAAGDMEPSGVQLRFYGARHGWIEKLKEKYGLADVVTQHGLVPREEARQRQMESQVLLLMKWNDPAHRGVYTAKIFEYLAAGRPVLAVGGYDDVVNELLDETQAGVWGQTPEDLMPLLLAMYRDYRASGEVPYHADPAALARYTHRELARKFAAVLDGVTR